MAVLCSSSRKTNFVRKFSVKANSKEIANRAQIARTVTPHVLRHTFATLAL